MTATFDITLLAQFFLLSVAFGFHAFSLVANSQLTGRGFIKLISNLSLGALSLLMVTLLMKGQTHSALFLAPLMLINLFVTLFHRDEKTLLMKIFYYTINAGFVFFLFRHFHLPKSTDYIFLLSSTLLLGSITYAMVLGHWYLVVPKLSEQPLVVLQKFIFIFLIGKILWSSWEVYTHWNFFQEGSIVGAGFVFNWVLLSMRLAFGYITLFVMSMFNDQLVKMRSIQSSTGIMYAMTFFVFIGELVSMYLYFYYGLKI